MKKLFTLLALLFTTLTAMALDFTDRMSVQEENEKANVVDNGQLTITQNADGTYNVTFHNCVGLFGDDTYDNFGTMTFSNIEGSTVDGITTVQGNVAAGSIADVENIGNPTNATVYAKFSEDPLKAYATLHTETDLYGTIIDVVFGTDEGWGTTGGGTGGGAETPTEVTVAEKLQTAQGVAWKYDATIDWATQKLVVSVNLAEAGADKAFLGVTTQGNEPDWVDNGIIFYNNNSNTVQGFVPGTSNNSNTNYVTKGSDPVRFEISQAEGVKCQGNVVIPASSLTVLTANSDIVVGVHGSKIAGAFYNYIKIVPLDWTEPTTPPFESSTLSKTDVAYTTFSNTTTNYPEMTVELTEYEEGKYRLTYKDLTIGTNRLGDFTIDNLVSESADELTLLATADTEGTWSNKSESAVISYLIPNETSAFDNFEASFSYDGEGQIEKLNLKFDLTIATGVANIVFGEKAVIPVEYTNTLYIVNKGTGEEEEHGGAKVTVVDKGEGKYQFTLPSFTDPDGDTVEPIVFVADGTTAYNKTTFTAANVEVALTGAWEGYVANVSMDGVVAYGQLTATFVVELGGLGDDYAYTLGFGVEPFTPETMQFSDWANIKIGDNKPVNYENVELEVTETSEDVYSITYKNFTVNGNEIGDLTINNVVSTTDESTGVATLTTTSTYGEWTRVVENNAAGFDAGDEVAIRNFEGTFTIVDNGGDVIVPGGGEGGVQYAKAAEDDLEGKLVVKFGVQLTGEWADVVFGEKYIDQETGINAVTTDGADVQLFTADGVKLSKLQKGLNIVRSADGKVKKVLVK